jgi:hypothetical protein
MRKAEACVQNAPKTEGKTRSRGSRGRTRACDSVVTAVNDIFCNFMISVDKICFDDMRHHTSLLNRLCAQAAVLCQPAVSNRLQISFHLRSLCQIHDPFYPAVLVVTCSYAAR